MRSTLNAVPTNNALLKKSKLPFALVIQPYGALHDQEDPIPVVSDQIISRCRRCRSYINPFVTFLDHGHRWRCNMCNLTNDVPQAFDWDAALQKPADRALRPDLNHSVVEFVVGLKLEISITGKTANSLRLGPSRVHGILNPP